MPYINRDKNGTINGLFAYQQYENQEFLSDDNAEVQEFLNPPPLENISLYKAENRFIEFCRSLNLPDKASREDFDNLTLNLKNQGQFMDATEIALKALALVNDITQNGGSWNNISWHPDLPE